MPPTLMPPTLMPLAAITVMLWILWSDSVRPRRSGVIAYSVRIVLFVAAAAVMIFNRVRYPRLFSTASTALVVVGVAVGLLGVAYFVRKIAQLRRA